MGIGNGDDNTHQFASKSSPPTANLFLKHGSLTKPAAKL